MFSNVKKRFEVVGLGYAKADGSLKTAGDTALVAELQTRASLAFRLVGE